ncbi:hypothetical protein K1728_05400 [Weissella confusa]|uniref:hypothetical protein n=1 Tax=Weissella confusa TaxID=1583 RepID=UPI001C6F87D9|nr:hypothetical protein [Weissella confusa]QYU58834.1 hypothetical protein K1728_05400 [Weissella confusa]
MASKTSVKKALAATVEQSELVTASMKQLDKEVLNAGVKEVETLFEEDPSLEALFGLQLKSLKSNLHFISRASAIVKNAQNVAEAAEAISAGVDRFMTNNE